MATAQDTRQAAAQQADRAGRGQQDPHAHAEDTELLGLWGQYVEAKSASDGAAAGAVVARIRDADAGGVIGMAVKARVIVAEQVDVTSGDPEELAVVAELERSALRRLLAAANGQAPVSDYPSIMRDFEAAVATDRGGRAAASPHRGDGRPSLDLDSLHRRLTDLERKTSQVHSMYDAISTAAKEARSYTDPLALILGALDSVGAIAIEELAEIEAEVGNLCREVRIAAS